MSGTGSPTPTFTATSLPGWLELTDNADGTATLAGSPPVGSGGTVDIVVRAANGFGDVATQDFTLTVEELPAITSAAATTFTVGSAGTFTVTTTPGHPAARTLSVTGPLPGGVSFTDNGDGTATLAGTPTESGTFPLTLTADNGILPAPTQGFALTVEKVVTQVALTGTTPTVYGEPARLTAQVTAAQGTPEGTVTFSVDGSPGEPVALDSGAARLTSSALTVGAHTVTATFAPSDAATYSGSSGSATHVVDKAGTRTVVTVGPDRLTATVTPIAPGAGVPSGSVTFGVAGETVGTAALSGSGEATFVGTVPTGAQRSVSATYAGDESFTGSSDSTARRDPKITARLTSTAPRSAAGWYRAPVRVTFTCTTAGSPLTSRCPAPVVLSRSGAGQTISRSVVAEDGGVGTVVVAGIDIDRTAPRVRVGGVRNGATYNGSAPRPVCVASDSLSGVWSCRISRQRRGAATLVTATATDRAGNVARARSSYRVLSTYVAGTRYSKGAFQTRRGRTYTLVVEARSRPRYYAAAPSPRRPFRYVTGMRRAGHGRWALAFTVTHRMAAHKHWNLGVKAGGHMSVIRIKVVR